MHQVRRHPKIIKQINTEHVNWLTRVKRKQLKLLFFVSPPPAPSTQPPALCVWWVNLQTTHRPSTREEMVIFCLKVHLPRQPHIALSCFLHLIFQNCLCRAQNWEGRTKVSLVITTKRREHSPIRITLKCTTPRARCKVQTTPERGWGGMVNAKLTKQKVNSGWKGNWSKPPLDRGRA